MRNSSVLIQNSAFVMKAVVVAVDAGFLTLAVARVSAAAVDHPRLVTGRVAHGVIKELPTLLETLGGAIVGLEDRPVSVQPRLGVVKTDHLSSGRLQRHPVEVRSPTGSRARC